jgi:D-cysteine desulfhydrase
MNAHHEQVRDLVRKNCASTIEIQGWDLASVWRSRADMKNLLRSCFDFTRGVIVPPGGTNALGALGYVAAGLELCAQVSAGLCPEPRRIYVPLGTGGTAAGLALGLALAGMRTEVVAVQVASLLVGHALALYAIAYEAKRLLCLLGAPIIGFPELRLRVIHGFIGKGYAWPTTQGEQAEALARSCNLPIESTYTAKTLAAMLSERSSSNDAEPWMFLDTFGPFSLVASEIP